ncbi:ATP-binding protein [Caldisericum exile]|uniref:histidine kinase n=1 Tax=Caldisericum exile (strain DSM 21853 / NBRC 104410 / AZM16c01) TaxID=511051 RepID=A0A7U6JGG3_CALEA|nr:ATP-binding protein [Caldisericum exile]BAL81679.1 putative two-component system hybrid sensor and regulator [Caldisericum exile AZM16c01]
MNIIKKFWEYEYLKQATIFISFSIIAFVLFAFYPITETHFLIELLSIFINASIFLIFVLTPTFKKTLFLLIIGVSSLVVAVLDFFHAVYFPGGGIRNDIILSLNYWMLARAVQSFGYLIATMQKEVQVNKKMYLNTIIIFLIAIPVLIFAGRFIPQGVFYVEGSGTTFLKYLLEVLFAVFFLIFALKERKVPELFFAGIFMALSEANFVYYKSILSKLVLTGHIFKITGAISMLFFASKYYIVLPLKEVIELETKYKSESRSIKNLFNEVMHRWDKVAELRNAIIALEDEENIYEKIKEFYRKKDDTIGIAIFRSGNLCYKNDPKYPDSLEKYDTDKFDSVIVNNNTTFFFDKSSPYLNIYKQLSLFISLVLENISEKKKLTELNAKLEEADQYRIEFIRGFSHELKTPLNVMSGYLQILMRGAYGKLSTQVEEIIKEIYKANLRAVETVNNLLDLSRLESHNVLPKAEKLNALQFLNETLASVEELSKQKGLEFIIEVDTDLIIPSDPKFLKMIVTNLASNAVKNTEKGFVKVSLKVNDLDFLKLIVSDSGIGIPEEKITEIFKPFVKGESQEGHGLGLSLVEKYVKALDGTISVKSEVGKGTVFEVTIPIFPHIDTTNIKKRNQIDFLVIEPDEGNRNFLKHLLRDYKVEVASNAREGIIKALEMVPKVVTVDYGLSTITGDLYIEKLREFPELTNTKFLLYTGKTLNRIFLSDIPVVEKIGINVEEFKEVLNALKDSDILFLYGGEFEATKEKLIKAIKNEHPSKGVFARNIKEFQFVNLSILFDLVYLTKSTDVKESNLIDEILKIRSQFDKEFKILGG